MNRRGRPGFSMTSLLILLGMLLLFLGMLLPFIAQLRRSAARSQSINNLRQIGIGIYGYHDVARGYPALVAREGTLYFHILPFLEQEPLQRKGKDGWTSIADQPLPIFLDPEDATAPPGNVFQGWLATTNYAGNWLYFRDGGMSVANILDGTSNTVMMTQRYQVCKGEPTGWAYARIHYWAPMYAFYNRARFQVAPGEACDPTLPQGLSSRGIWVMLGDASVRLVAPTCSPMTWSAVTTPADGLGISEDF